MDITHEQSLRESKKTQIQLLDGIFKSFFCGFEGLDFFMPTLMMWLLTIQGWEFKGWGRFAEPGQQHPGGRIGCSSTRQKAGKKVSDAPDIKFPNIRQS